MEKEKCVHCGKPTPYDQSTPIEIRQWYVEGSGQLCEECWNKLYNGAKGNEHMTELRKKKEFLYLLDGKYYIIGRCECKECDDGELIGLYQEFLSLTDNELFKDFDPREIRKSYRDKIADVFSAILRACHVPIEQSEMTDEKVLLRERLEKKYGEEINAQITRWLKADTCATYKEIEEKHG